MERYLHIGRVVAVDFDPTGEYPLVITHWARGVFSTRTWERVARNTKLAYPEDGVGIGIGSDPETSGDQQPPNSANGLVRPPRRRNDLP